MTDPYRADCTRCVGLCCVASPFSKSADFAIDKPAGTPCRHLGPDHRCGIHARLPEAGFPGCVSFDCYGAGQRLVQLRADGADWRADPGTAPEIFDAFYRLLGICELGWHVHAAMCRPELPAEHRAPLAAAQAAIEAAERTPAPAAALRRSVSELLSAVSADVRAHHGALGPDHSRTMQLGAAWRGRRLARASLFATCLVGADLRGADLRHADLRGTDLRGARVHGADLRGVLFLTAGQLVRTRGDAHTRLSPECPRPAHWA